MPRNQPPDKDPMEWIPLGAAINMLVSAGVESDAYLELLEAMAIPIRKRSLPLSRVLGSWNFC